MDSSNFLVSLQKFAFSSLMNFFVTVITCYCSCALLRLAFAFVFVSSTRLISSSLFYNICFRLKIVLLSFLLDSSFNILFETVFTEIFPSGTEFLSMTTSVSQLSRNELGSKISCTHNQSSYLFLSID